MLTYVKTHPVSIQISPDFHAGHKAVEATKTLRMITYEMMSLTKSAKSVLVKVTMWP